MRLMARSIALAVVVSLTVGGPLATFARAQQPAEPQQPEPLERVRTMDSFAESAVYTVGAGVANVVYIPGKTALCALGVVVGGGLLLLTLGAGYKGAAAFAHEGCGGKWVLKPGDLRETDFLLGSAERSERH